MADVNLIKYKLGKLGYTFFEVGEKIIIDSLIIELIKSEEKRYLKAIPFLIYQSYTDPDKKSYLDLEKLQRSAKENGLGKELNAILFVTMEIFRMTGDRKDMMASISLHLKKHSSEKEQMIFEMLFKNKTGFQDEEFEDYARNVRINWIDIGEFSSDFLMHKSIREIQDKQTLKERLEISQSRNMLIYLSELFSPRQREIIQKIIDDKPLGKTEYEYYIRIIKKRLEALSELKELADNVVKKKPKRFSDEKTG